MTEDDLYPLLAPLLRQALNLTTDPKEAEGK